MLKEGIKNKRGQFYLIASVIIIVIVAGIVSVSNYPIDRGISRVSILGEELEIESEKVLDYDALNNQNEIENFTRVFSSYLGSRINASYILGRDPNIEAYTFSDGERIDLNSDLSVDSETITFNYAGSVYNFDLNAGQNFYFVILQEEGGEKYVYTN